MQRAPAIGESAAGENEPTARQEVASFERETNFLMANAENITRSILISPSFYTRREVRVD